MKMNTIILIVTGLLLAGGAGMYGYYSYMASPVIAKPGEGEGMNNNISDVTMKDIDGNPVNFADYKGKVLLIVNVASKCGYTKQYSDLEAIYQKYKDQGFLVLGFPCNDFGNQEPGTADEIKEFCSTTFNVSFPLFEKVTVLANKSPLFEKLTNNSVTGDSAIRWNFEKFLIDKEGNIVARFRSGVKPTDTEITSVIERELSKN